MIDFFHRKKLRNMFDVMSKRVRFNEDIPVDYHPVPLINITEEELTEIIASSLEVKFVNRFEIATFIIGSLRYNSRRIPSNPFLNSSEKLDIIVNTIALKLEIP